MRYVFTGNIHDPDGDSTWCHGCGGLLIGRDRYIITEWNLDDRSCCRDCGTQCAGVFEAEPGAWGGRRVPVSIERLSLQRGGGPIGL